jgi:hypothetical protein
LNDNRIVLNSASQIRLLGRTDQVRERVPEEERVRFTSPLSLPPSFFGLRMVEVFFVGV